MTVSPCQHYLARNDWNRRVPHVTDKTTPATFNRLWKKAFGDKAELSVALPGGFHPMLNAAKFNNVNLILHFYAKDKSVLDLGNSRGWTPLIYAAHRENREAVEILVKLGANVNLCTLKRSISIHSFRRIPRGVTSLWIATTTKNVAVTKFLLMHGAIVYPQIENAEALQTLEQAKSELITEGHALASTLDSAIVPVLPLALIKELVEYVLSSHATVSLIPNKKRKEMS